MTDDEPKPSNPLDPFGALRGVSEIGELGLRAAGAVIEQMLTLSRQLTESRFPVAPLEGMGETTAREPGDRRRDLRHLRADAERLIELYGEWTRTLLDSAATLADGGGPERTDVLVFAGAVAGEEATATAYLHVLEGPVAPDARLHAGVLVAHDGSTVPGVAVSFDPAAVDTSSPQRTDAVVVVVAVPEGTPAGVYHGHVLAEGLPEICLPLRLEVVR